jgi:arabinofuranosyltransferase
MQKIKEWPLYLSLTIFCCWASYFIFRTSAIGLDGHRYWVLFDDAMISMRYALNLVNGHGLVWNPGQYVEGFTNPLWTMIMALAIAFFGKLTAPLVIQVLGLLLVATAAFLTKRIADKLLGDNTHWSYLALLLVLSYYPLMYWSLSGMEVSALAFLVALALYVAICRPDLPSATGKLYAIVCVAYLVRPDGFLALLPILVIHGSKAPKKHLRGITAFLLVVVSVTLARYIYYGELLPNTYTLKMGGYSLEHRLRNGVAFISPFLRSTAILWILAGLAIYTHRRKSWLVPACIVAIPAIDVVYQVYVGGDPWPRWRQVAPGIIPLAVVALIGVKNLLEAFKLPRSGTLFVSLALSVVFIVFMNKAFYKGTFTGKPADFRISEKHVQTAELLNEIMPNGQVMVFWAGTVPYYFDGYALDAFGKSDKYIASLPPDNRVAWGGMLGVPGHAKHSLQYDLNRSPDYLQPLSLAWKLDNFARTIDLHYIAVLYRGHLLCVRNGSPNINWNRVDPIGTCTAYRRLLF